MKIVNLSKNKLLVKNSVYLISPFQKTLGLLDKSKESVIFKTRFGIHTFGLKSPIDVVICDKNLKVVSAAKRLPPNRLYFWNFKYNLVIESKMDLIVDLGDKLKIYD